MFMHLCVHVHIYIFMWTVPSLLIQTKISMKTRRIVLAIKWRFRIQMSLQDKVLHKVIFPNSSRLLKLENMPLGWISKKKPTTKPRKNQPKNKLPSSPEVFINVLIYIQCILTSLHTISGASFGVIQDKNK